MTLWLVDEITIGEREASQMHQRLGAKFCLELTSTRCKAFN